MSITKEQADAIIAAAKEATHFRPHHNSEWYPITCVQEEGDTAAIIRVDSTGFRGIIPTQKTFVVGDLDYRTVCLSKHIPIILSPSHKPNDELIDLHRNLTSSIQLLTQFIQRPDGVAREYFKIVRELISVFAKPFYPQPRVASELVKLYVKEGCSEVFGCTIILTQAVAKADVAVYVENEVLAMTGLKVRINNLLWMLQVIEQELVKVLQCQPVPGYLPHTRAGCVER